MKPCPSGGTRIAGSKSACVSLLALCSLVSASAQTTASTAGVSSNESATALNGQTREVRRHCPATIPESEGSEINTSTSAAGSSSQTQSASCQDIRQLAVQFTDERLAVWRKHLKLDDWKISLVMTRRSDLKPRTRGHIRWDKGKKSAVLCVLDALDYQLPLREMLDDMEFTIVHELVHLELASLPRSEASRSSEEHAVNRLTEALLMLNRQK